MHASPLSRPQQRAITTTNTSTPPVLAAAWPLRRGRSSLAIVVCAASASTAPTARSSPAAPPPRRHRHHSALPPCPRRPARTALTAVPAGTDADPSSSATTMPPPPLSAANDDGGKTTAAAAPAAPSAAAAAVTVFTTQACPYCRKAKALLQSRGIAYREVDVENARELRAAVAAASGGRRTVPQVFFGSAHVGGSDDLAAADLAALLAAPAAREALPRELEAAVQAAGHAAEGQQQKQQQQQQQQLTLVDRAEADVRGAYLALLRATAAPAASSDSAAAPAAPRVGPTLAALAAARRRRRGEAPAGLTSSTPSSSLFEGEDEREQRAADAVYRAALVDPAAEQPPSGGGAASFACSFTGAELVAALAELSSSDASSASSSSSSHVALARRLVQSNLVNVAGAARRPDPTDACACLRFFGVTPAKRLRLLEDTLSLAREEAEDAAAADASAFCSCAPAGPLAALQKLLQRQQQPAAAAAAAAQGSAPDDYARPLNAPFWWAGPARPAADVAEGLRARVLRLYDAHLRLDSATGRTVVAYGALRRDGAFWGEYVALAAELQAVSDLAALPRDALAALAINLYNALVVHGLAVFGPERALGTAARRMAFFQRGARYVIGGDGGARGVGAAAASAAAAAAAAPASAAASDDADAAAAANSVRWGGLVYTCDALEHGILRGNRPGAAAPTMLLGLGLLGAPLFAPFKEGDPRRRAVVPPPVDARVHFALVCGAASCPPIRTYSASTLDEGLAAAAEAFCASSVRIEEEDGGGGRGATVRLSKIFGWYYVDFGASKAERLRWLLPYLPAAKREALGRLLARDPSAGSIKLAYDPYDWTANAADE